MKTYEVHFAPESWGAELQTDSLAYAQAFARSLSWKQECYITKYQNDVIARYKKGKKAK